MLKREQVVPLRDDAELRLRELVENPQIRTHVTFWGTRMVTVGEDAIPLEIISSIVFRALDLNNRRAHLGCVGWTVSFLYDATDIQIHSANVITRIFVWLREEFFITKLIYGSPVREHARSVRGLVW